MNSHFDQQSWRSLSLIEQMGNISSEVGRTFNGLRVGNKQRADGAFFRAIDLMNASIKDLAKLNSYRTKELLLARDQFAKAFCDQQADDKLESYFNYFAILARSER